MADLKLDGLTVASSSGSPTVVNLDSDVASRITAKGIAKAWVRFDGNTSPYNRIDSFNVSGITRNTDGDYTVSFENDMANDNYCVCASAIRGNGYEPLLASPKDGTFAVGSVGVVCKTDGGVAEDAAVFCVAIFGS